MKTLAAVLVLVFALFAQTKDVDHRLKTEFDDLSARATAAINTVNAMEDRARQDNQALHPDLVGQRALVQSAMDDAAAALRDQNESQLRERLKRARGVIGKLYKML